MCRKEVGKRKKMRKHFCEFSYNSFPHTYTNARLYSPKMCWCEVQVNFFKSPPNISRWKAALDSYASPRMLVHLQFKALTSLQDQNNPVWLMDQPNWLEKQNLNSWTRTQCPPWPTPRSHSVRPSRLWLGQETHLSPHNTASKGRSNQLSQNCRRSPKEFPFPSPPSPSPCFSYPSSHPPLLVNNITLLPAWINTVSPCLQAFRECDSLEIPVVRSLRSQIS